MRHAVASNCTRVGAAAVLTALAWCGHAAAMPQGGHRVEAESQPIQSDARLAAFDGQPGQGVTSDRAWEPVLRTQSLGDWQGSARVWVRHTGGPLNLKSLAGAEQADLAWVWAQPTEPTWTAFGVFTREALGQGVLVIRGEEGSPVVDAIVFEPLDATPAATPPATPPANPAADAKPLPVSLPHADTAPREVTMWVDWTRTTGPITRLHWAVNDYSVVKEQLAGQPELNQYVAEVNPQVVRLHWSQLVDEWTDAETRTWDAAKIKARLDAAKGFHHADLMLCINWWPQWLHQGEVLPAELEQAFIQLCAEAPKVFREIGHPLAMIELPNEREGHYEKAGELDRLWLLYARCVEAIRDGDADVKVGGPALTWPKPAWVESFIAHGGLAVSDFFTWHNYASGEATDSNAYVFAAADRLGDHAHYAMQALAQAGHPEMPGYLTEYNVSWVWTTRDARMGTNVGAIFQALVIKNLAEAGATGAFVWHVQDNIYGLLNNDGTRRAPAELFLWNHHLVGQMHPVATQDTTALEGLAVRRADGSAALLLIVKADGPVRVHLPAPTGPGTAWHPVGWIVPEGFDPPRWHDGHPNVLPGYSLLLLSTQP